MKHRSEIQTAITLVTIPGGNLVSMGRVVPNGQTIPSGVEVQVDECPGENSCRIAWCGLNAWTDPKNLNPVPERTWS